MKIIVAHPGKQHSFFLAEALEKAGMLEAYVTTVYNADHSLTRLVGKFLKGDDRKRFLSRKNEVFDKKVIRTQELMGLFYLFLIRRPSQKKLCSKVEHYLHRKTYYKALRLAKKTKADAIVLYGGYQKEHYLYKEKHCPDVKVIIDVPICTNNYLKSVFEHDIEVTGNRYIRTEQASSWDEVGYEAIRFWATHADGYLVGSSFVKRSLEFVGTEPSKIKIVHYGVDTKKFSQKKHIKRKDQDRKVTFIFVGNVNRRKGIQHLLPAFEKLKSDTADLMIVGKYDENDPLFIEYSKKKNIRFYGFVTKDEVAELYKKADVFILPSLGEGMAQVGIEAMSCGLPVICSENSGVNDIINEGENGFVVPVSDKEVLFEKMKWFMLYQEEIPRMGSNARTTALSLTWDDYARNICKAIRELMKDDEDI